MSPHDDSQEEFLARLVTRLRPEMERLMDRFRIPAAHRQEILETLLQETFRHRSRGASLERWLLGNLEARCQQEVKLSRDLLCRALDAGLQTVLAGEPEKDEAGRFLRFELERALDRLPEPCRSHLRRRYGLPAAADLEDPSPSPGSGEDLVHCLTLLGREIFHSELP